ncbi:MAG TPA: riboflavin synthase [Microbacteriaceae bacterium]|nr:riboflavin synthase [Microbacteriaceae bacterium]
MFTGLIEEIGEITAIEPVADSLRLTVRGPLVVSDAQHGASICVSGVCLTVIEQSSDSFTADVMAQSIRMSALGGAVVGTKVNLERAAALGDRLGGHIVQGHVDGTGTVIDVRPAEQWRVLRVRISDDLAPLVVDKGSITIDGVSLTLSAIGSDAEGHWGEVSLIPETLIATTLGERVVGDLVNLETDIVARHVQRLMQFTNSAEIPSSLQPGNRPQRNGASA